MPDDWWRTAFDACYLERYAHRDAAEAEAAVAAIMPRLRGVRGPVLDAGCGAGRHLAVLRAAGVPAFGFDFSADLLTRAPASVRRGTVRADLRALPFAERSCGAVLLFFTVFGYFSEDENARVLSSLVRLCAPDGFVLLDLPDAERITLVPRTERRLADGTLIVEERRRSGARIEKTIRCEARAPITESVRIYTRDDLMALAAANRCVAVIEPWRDRWWVRLHPA